MPEETLVTLAMSVVTDQFKALKHGNVTGSVFRLMAEDVVPLYDCPTKGANVMRKLKPGALLVAFSDPGPMRQVNTADQVFGYIPRTAKLLPVTGIDADGLYDPEKRAAAEAALPPIEDMCAAQAATEKRARFHQNLFVVGMVAVFLLAVLTIFLTSPAVPKK